MHKHHSDRKDRFRDFSDTDGDWNEPSPRRGRSRPRHARHKRYDEFLRSRLDDWLDPIDDDRGENH